MPFPRAFARLRLRQLAEPQTGEGPKSGPEVRIGPTNLMHRNPDHRVGVLVHVADTNQVQRLLDYVYLQMYDETSF